MAELRILLEHWRHHADAPGVLATVVHVRGSAYRRPGARMLLLEDGARIGSISGGCLEGDLARKAWWWTSSGKPTVRVYDTTSEEDAVWEFGLGCNGVVEVLLERFDSPSTRQLFEFIDRARKSSAGAIVATVIATQPGSDLTIGDRLFFDPDLAPHGPLQSRLPSLAAALDRAWRRRANCLVHLEDASVFLEWVGKPNQLFVFGAGHDAQPVVEIAALLGLSVTVCDGRPAYLCQERFPKADHIYRIPPSGDISNLGINSDSLVVLMTHNFPQDERLLPQILPHSPRYLGLLGPTRRTERLFQHLQLDPLDYPLHAPVGLDIGADTPEAIAVSILSEIQCVLAGRDGGFLRLRRQKIHADVEELGASSLPPSQSAGLAACQWSASSNV